MPNILQIKGNQTMKFGQLIEYNKINIFFENHAENEAGRLVFVFEKSFIRGKSKWSAASF